MLITPLCWFSVSTLGLILFQIIPHKHLDKLTFTYVTGFQAKVYSFVVKLAFNCQSMKNGCPNMFIMPVHCWSKGVGTNMHHKHKMTIKIIRGLGCRSVSKVPDQKPRHNADVCSTPLVWQEIWSPKSTFSADSLALFCTAPRCNYTHQHLRTSYTSQVPAVIPQSERMLTPKHAHTGRYG